MMKLLFTLFVLVFPAHGMQKKSETTYHVPTPHDIELINQNLSNQNENKEHKAYNDHAEDEYEETEEKSELVDKYQYLEVIIGGNEEYHNQLKGLYQKNVYYNVSYYTKILPDDGKNTSIVWISGAWVFVHNQKRIAHLEDQNLINPLMFNYYTKRIILENFSREPIHLRTWDFCPISPHGNYYEHVDKYVIYRFEINDGKYEMGHAKYLPFDAKWQTFPWGQNGEISKNAKDYSWKVREMLEKLSDPHRNFRSNHFPALMYSGSPWDANVYFFPLLDSNIAIPPNKELRIDTGYFKAEHSEKFDSPNSDDVDTMSTMDTITGSTPNHKNEINIDFQNENEDFWKKNEDFCEKNEEFKEKNNCEEFEYFSSEDEKKI